ncbi:DUF485 domain-containing protein [Rhodopirellula sp. P2]|uniref:DUF485 domain-containing protein n=1 Tax=Rhodopirellula sp. P2 TaxID=2127060 RepID=UPI00236876D9|nr:DUF485 domain-containing protein [Rhodopirellula sp. P2]WDQ16936.1 DUF485 domain-containing protein [Rhodopirellula sp. P2]
MSASDPAPESEPSVTSDVSTPLPAAPASDQTSRLGWVLFVIYLLLYGGFVLLNAFKAEVMDTIVFAGLNLAIVYGFALILVAIGMALIYGMKTVDEPQASEASE